MTLDEVLDLPDEDLEEWRLAIFEEIYRRQVLQEAATKAAEIEEKSERELDDLSAGYLRARDGKMSSDDPADWVQPDGPHNAYPKNWPVSHQGKIWRSIVPCNDHEPGTDHGQAWVEVVPEPPAGEYTPWGTGQVVQVEDLRTHNGKLWRAKVDHTTHIGWEPSAAAHAVWEDLGPVPEKKPIGRLKRVG